MKNKQITSAILILCILLTPAFVGAEDKPATDYPGLEPVTEAAVKGIGVIKVGGKVLHRKFGIGVVKSIHLGDDATTVNVVFETRGSKWLVAEYANLMVIND